MNARRTILLVGRRRGVDEWFRAAPLWQKALLTVAAAANLILVAITIYGFVASGVGYDWQIFKEAGRRVGEGTLYEWAGTYAWSYSPLLAHFFGFIAPIGLLGWSALHVAALWGLRDRSAALLTIVLWPFWIDVYNGNTMVFVFVAAFGALRGGTVATAAYLALVTLMPRPLMLPLLVWILWKRPLWRLPFVLIGGASLAAAFATGYLGAWVVALAGVGDAVAVSSRDIGPAVLLGQWWIVVGVVLAAYFTIRGNLGWASLAASPYWLPQYLLMLVLELVPGAESAAVQQANGSIQLRNAHRPNHAQRRDD